MIKIRVIEKTFRIYGQMYKRYIINCDDMNYISEDIRHMISIKRKDKASDYNSKKSISVYLIETHMQDNGEYEFDCEDEDWQSSYVEEESYIPIQFDPISGEEIQVSIVRSENIQEQCNEYKKEYDEVIKKRHKLNDFNYMEDVLKKFEDLFNDKYVSNKEFQNNLNEDKGEANVK